MNEAPHNHMLNNSSNLNSTNVGNVLPTFSDNSEHSDDGEDLVTHKDQIPNTDTIRSPNLPNLTKTPWVAQSAITMANSQIPNDRIDITTGSHIRKETNKTGERTEVRQKKMNGVYSETLNRGTLSSHNFGDGTRGRTNPALQQTLNANVNSYHLPFGDQIREFPKKPDWQTQDDRRSSNDTALDKNRSQNTNNKTTSCSNPFRNRRDLNNGASRTSIFNLNPTSDNNNLSQGHNNDAADNEPELLSERDGLVSNIQDLSFAQIKINFILVNIVVK